MYEKAASQGRQAGSGSCSAKRAVTGSHGCRRRLRVRGTFARFLEWVLDRI
jgi:hypothetical protein